LRDSKSLKVAFTDLWHGGRVNTAVG
jgi:hypothetical protein